MLAACTRLPILFCLLVVAPVPVVVSGMSGDAMMFVGW